MSHESAVVVGVGHGLGRALVRAIAAYESAAYQAALALLKGACVCEARIVPGVAEPT